MKQLIQDVINWGKEKGIHDKLSANSQRVLAIGELCNEFPDAIAKGKPSAEVKKELGDVLVFYINYLVMRKPTNTSATRLREINISTIIFKDAENACLEVYGEYTSYYDIIIRGLRVSHSGYYCAEFVEAIAALAKRIDSSLEECLRLAHEKNLGREHEMRDGKLVKREDL